MPINVLTLQAPTTQSAPFVGSGVSVAGITGDFTIKLRINSLTAGNNARFVFEETVNAFSTVVETGVGFSTGTGMSAPEGQVLSWHRRDFGNLTKFGITSGQVRLNLVELDGGTISYQAWIES